MEYLTIHEAPPAKTSHLVMAFKGWPDAGDGASSAIRYLLRKFSAKKFAELDPEEFYDFTQVRPQTSINREGLRVAKWPANELFYCTSEEPSQNLMFFLGVEPNLKWKTFSRTIIDKVETWGVKTVVHIGSLLDAVPHTRDVRISGSSNLVSFKKTLEGQNIGPSNYQGPTGITSAIMEACTASGMNYATIWGHTPHYLQAAPNYRVSYALISHLSRMLGFKIALDELQSAAVTFDKEVEKAVSKDAQIGAYVQKLEQSYDETATLVPGDMPKADDVVRELEEFLKGQQKRNWEDESPG